MRSFTPFSRLICIALLSLFFSGCASKGPVDLKIQGDAAAVINRDNSGKSLSLVLHLYQLKSADEFTRLTFDTFASGRPSNELLGNTLIAQSEFVMLPGQQGNLPITLQTETQFIAVVGFFRKPDPQFWRALIKAEDLRDSKQLTIKAEDCYLQIVSPKAQLIPGQPMNFQANCGIAPAKSTKKIK
ncbi:type VI secretion system lipoprotein TssJ [Chitinibacter fontanus]|uniref:Type VI secretion system lipoprotein TssJ n=1 Tax=Chitinibacter fontanus TaxID=1737446 RepID=A0A7D5VAB3_9NEIS|nr:type VI secretion system lipoprotein TssJ [Chitinibacter fontanus]QLI81293.1 type VI secretion system lipoprotein TssJ [Chitinibacter fontanus]